MIYSINGLYGGLIIGVASALLLLMNGRIAGISGIAKGIMAEPTQWWRSLFVVGLVVGALIYQWTVGPIVMDMQAGRLQLLIAGLIVGVGTSMGSGCTSGHGICGLGRGSKRSIAATVTFMAVAVLTVYVVRHIL